MAFSNVIHPGLIFHSVKRMNRNTVESRLYVQVGTQKFGRRTERDVTSENNLSYNAMKSILDETIPIGRISERDLQLTLLYNRVD